MDDLIIMWKKTQNTIFRSFWILYSNGSMNKIQAFPSYLFIFTESLFYRPFFFLRSKIDTITRESLTSHYCKKEQEGNKFNQKLSNEEKLLLEVRQLSSTMASKTF